MPRMTISRRDPYWDMDGESARRTRLRRTSIRSASWLLILGVFVLAALNLPSIDADYLIRGTGRPVLAGALMALLGSAALLALARVRRVGQS